MNPGLTRAEHAYLQGIRHNREQFVQQLLQVFLVGLTLGMLRTVVPALAETQFGVPRDSFTLLMAFVVAFGFIKGALNFVAGSLSERIGRKRVLLLGWVTAVPIPFLILYAQSWSWIVAATVLLGINQGFTWSMTQTSKLDLSRADQRGLAIGLNEFAGYVGVAIAGIITAYLAHAMGPREGLFLFGALVISCALVMTLTLVRETLPWARAEGMHKLNTLNVPTHTTPDNPSTRQVFALLTWRDKSLAALNQAGHVEKFVDALVWVVYPVFLFRHGLSLAKIGWVVGAYGLVWGCSQFFTGRLSDRIGRKKPIVWGMWLCGIGVALMLLCSDFGQWVAAAALSGFGMALLYPNLSAAVADRAHPIWRGSAIGIYRFWRDTGYGVGALLLGVIGQYLGLSADFWFVAIAMLASGTYVWLVSEETHPRFKRAM